MLDLGPIRAREKAATKGPWQLGIVDPAMDRTEWWGKTLSHGSADEIWLVWSESHPDTKIGDDPSSPDHVAFVAITGNGPTSEANADFVLAARVDIPALVEEVERLRESLEWYADEANYDGGPGSALLAPVLNDGGQRARALLTPAEAKAKGG